MIPKGKIAYEKVFIDYGYGYNRIKLTGKCLTKDGGPRGVRKYYQIETKVLFWKKYRWVPKGDVYFFDPETSEVYDCSCGEKE